MKILLMRLAILMLLSHGFTFLNHAEGKIPARAASAELPSPEMQRLLNAFEGKWAVQETFETSSSRQGKSRQGVATFRSGPGFSLIEDYESSGSAGPLNFLALLWWDPSAQVYRLLTCANNDGCQLRGTAKWEGNSLVNSWQEKVEGEDGKLQRLVRGTLSILFPAHLRRLGGWQDDLVCNHPIHEARRQKTMKPLLEINSHKASPQMSCTKTSKLKQRAVVQECRRPEWGRAPTEVSSWTGWEIGRLEPTSGLEPLTCRLRIGCSTN